jgi:peptidoglycan/LPS O-acetylase OafA/YrhL
MVLIPAPVVAVRERQPCEPGSAPAAEPIRSALPGRLPFVDGLRGLAMLMVLAFHCWFCLGIRLPITLGPWTVDAMMPLRHGYLGVHLFLVLSGFCLTYPLAKEGGAGMRLDLRRFMARRAWRILPPYYIALAFFSLRPALEAGLRAALGKPVGSGEHYTAGQVLSHVFLVHNLSPAWVRTINGSFWSLALEWQLYLVFPLLVWGFRRFGPARTLAAVLALTVAYRTWVYLEFVTLGGLQYRVRHAVDFCLAYATLPARLFEFALGMLAAVKVAGMRAAPTPAATGGFLRGAVLCAVLGLCLTHFWSPFSPITDVAWGLASYCLLLFAGGRSATGGCWLEARPLVSLGLISYSVYLVHEPLVRRIAGVLQPLHLSPVSGLIVYGLLVAPLAIACGWLYFRLVESRFVRATGASGARKTERRGASEIPPCLSAEVPG